MIPKHVSLNHNQSCTENFGICIIWGAETDANWEPIDIGVRPSEVVIAFTTPVSNGKTTFPVNNAPLPQDIATHFGFSSVTLVAGNYTVDYTDIEYPFGIVTIQANTIQ